MSKRSKYSDLKRTSNEQPLKEVLDRWMKAYGFEERAKNLEVVEAWPELMGTAVANRTREISIRNKMLYLKMDSSVMRDELAHGKQIIIQRVNEFVGSEVIVDVWFG
ncbi:MAG: DUF721 domain-containing protein [Fluviicola sp.]|nr:DUF721 domain-containing protein [Fluviicola sp.]